MLLLPFASALVLAGRLSWQVLPAAVVLVGVFLIREPLVTLWRQAALWKQPRPEAAAARSALARYAPFLAIAGAVLFWKLPRWPLLVMGLAAAVLTAVSVDLIVHNRQRSLLLQVSIAAGLNASALVAWLAVRQHLDPVVLWLWCLQFLHSAAALLAVRARLEARLAARGRSDVAVMLRRAAAAQAVLLLAAVACIAGGRVGPAAALALSGGIHGVDLVRLRSPSFVALSLRRVGLRELLLSLVFSAVTIAGLWPN